MAKFGTKEHPAIIRVQNMQRGEEFMTLCNRHGWQVIVGIEPDKPEDISDIDRLLNPPRPFINNITIGRNDPCNCGSGKKYKNCCMNN